MKIHLQDLIFDELSNSDNILDYICEGYAPIILLFDKISHRLVPMYNNNNIYLGMETVVNLFRLLM